MPPARGAADDAEQRPDGKLEASVQPWLQLLPGPRVHADFAASSAFAVADEERAASLIKVRFAKRERFVDAQPGSPQDHDEASQPPPVRAVSGRAHHCD